MTAGSVLLLAEYGVLNGGERSLLAVLEQLQSLEWRFQAAVPADSELETALSKLGIPNHGLELRDSEGLRFSQPEIRERIVDLWHRSQADLLHCNSLAMSRLAGPLSAEHQIPIVGYLRDILKLSRKAIQDLNGVSQLIAVSRATRDFHVGQGVDPDRVQVIYNGVDADMFSSPQPLDPAGVRPDWESGQATLLFVGQLGMRKGVDVAIEVADRLQSRFPNVTLWVVGERNSQKQEAVDYELYLRQRAIEVGNVQFLGRRNDVPALMQRATVLLHPARQEPLGRVLLESAAAGLPIVTTMVGGSAEILRFPGSQQYLLPVDGVDSLVAAVAGLITDQSRRNIVGNQLRNIAREKFSIQRCSRQLDRVYRQLIGPARH